MFLSCKPYLFNSSAVNSNFSSNNSGGVVDRVNNNSSFAFYNFSCNGVGSSSFFSVLGFVTAGYHAYTCEYSERKE